jgi:hypothetical protein
VVKVPAFNRSNVTVYLLGVFIFVALVLALGVWLFYSPSRTSMQDRQHETIPNKEPAPAGKLK